MNVYDPILGITRREPRLTAVITPSARLSFADLDRAVNRAGHAIASCGLTAGERVGVSVRLPSMHLVLALALARLGIPHVALPVFDPPLVRRSVAAQLELSAVIASIEDAGEIGVPAIEPDPDWLANKAPAPEPPPMPRDQNRVWLIVKSSGTTGDPKFAELTHGAAMQRSLRFRPLFGAAPPDVFWPLSTLDFVVAKQRTLFCLQMGAAVLLPEGLKTHRERVEFAREEQATLACGTPFHMDVLASMGFPVPALPTLRVFEARSATIGERLRQRFRAMVTDNLYIVYATNETETISMATPSLQSTIRDTVGVPVPGITVEVVDAADRALPPGEVGQIRIRGPGIIREYVANPAATTNSFRDGWFYPGDLASLTPEGAILLQGRTDDMMIYDGINIYPAEIEKVLADHPAVAEAAAFPIHADRHQHIPAAAVVAATPVRRSELVAYCKARLGASAPAAIFLLKSLPRNAMGKVLKRELSTWAGRRVARIKR